MTPPLGDPSGHRAVRRSLLARRPPFGLQLAPWSTCISVSEVLLDHARRHPTTAITVLCDHTHGRGEHRPLEGAFGAAKIGEPPFSYAVKTARIDEVRRT